jgi:ABC-type branched-subunit amino acid transport system substrate-binding protein
MKPARPASAQSPERVAFIEKYRARYNQNLEGPVFVIGAYDAIYLYKFVMERDGTDPKAIRAGLENVPSFKGLIKNFDRPVFTHDRHNSLTEDDMIMTRWTNGAMLPVNFDAKGPYVQIDANTRKYIDRKNLSLM